MTTETSEVPTQGSARSLHLTVRAALADKLAEHLDDLDVAAIAVTEALRASLGTLRAAIPELLDGPALPAPRVVDGVVRCPHCDSTRWQIVENVQSWFSLDREDGNGDGVLRFDVETRQYADDGSPQGLACENCQLEFAITEDVEVDWT